MLQAWRSRTAAVVQKTQSPTGNFSPTEQKPTATGSKAANSQSGRWWRLINSWKWNRNFSILLGKRQENTMMVLTLASRSPLLIQLYLLSVVTYLLLHCLNSPPFRIFRLPNKRLALVSSSPVSKHLMSSFMPSPFSRSFPPTFAGQQSIFPSLP